jgi:hypothetical protein
MPLFNSQIHWQGMGNTVAVGLLTLPLLVTWNGHRTLP